MALSLVAVAIISTLLSRFDSAVAFDMVGQNITYRDDDFLNNTVAASSCIVINEVMYDPEATPDGDYEWIELYNMCNETIDLVGWKISDNSSADEIPLITITPYGFVVIAAKAVFLDDYPDYYSGNSSVVFINGSIGSGLNNDGDRVSLMNNSGFVVDEISYGKDKSVLSLPDVDEGGSLERRPAGGGFGENIKPTPGFGWQETIPTSTPMPMPTLTQIPTPTLTPMPMPTVTPEPTPNVTPIPTLTITPIPTMTPKPTPSVTPTLTLTITPSPTPLPLSTPGSTIIMTPTATPEIVPTPTIVTGTIGNLGDVLINEIMYDAVATPDTDHEWIEFYNTCDEIIELVGWRISDNSCTDVIPDVTIVAGGFLVVAATAGFFADYPNFKGTVVLINGSIGSGLNNDGDRITLTDSSGNIIDEVSYGKDRSVLSLPGVLQGHSLERQAANGEFADNEEPTPGRSPPSVKPTAVPTPLPSPSPADTPNLTPTPTVISTATPVASATPAFAGTVSDRGDILINEVQYDSQRSGTDTAYEWIELYNTRSEAISLIGWTVTDNKEADPIPAMNLSPYGFAIFAASIDFLVDFPDYNGTIVFSADNRIGNGLGNEGDRLILKDSSGTPIDELSYGDDSSITSPSYTDVAEGHSLERVPCGGHFIDNEVPTPGACLIISDIVPITSPTPGSTAMLTAAVSNLMEPDSNDSIKTNKLHSSDISRPASSMAHTSSSGQSGESSCMPLLSLLLTLHASLLMILAWMLYRHKTG